MHSKPPVYDSEAVPRLSCGHSKQAICDRTLRFHSRMKTENCSLSSSSSVVTRFFIRNGKVSCE